MTKALPFEVAFVDQATGERIEAHEALETTSAAALIDQVASFARHLLMDVDAVEGWTSVAERSLNTAVALLEMAAEDERRVAEERLI